MGHQHVPHDPKPIGEKLVAHQCEETVGKISTEKLGVLPKYYASLVSERLIAEKLLHDMPA